METVEAIGLIAAALSVGSFVPQVWKIIKTKKTRDLSLLMWLVFTLGAVLWIWYGLMVNDTAILATNIPIFLLSLIVLSLKLRYK